jgi:hypothetical protein
MVHGGGDRLTGLIYYLEIPEACSAERALAIVRMHLPLNGSASYSLAAEL